MNVSRRRFRLLSASAAINLSFRKQLSSAMKKFEYRLLNPESGVFKGYDYEKLTTLLNLLGSQGWEVVSTVSAAAGHQMNSLLITLKREIQ